MQSRAEHLEWCKQRAREYLAIGEWQNAMTSMVSDLGKHPETERSREIGGYLMLTVSDVESCRKFVEGFN